MKTLRLVLSLGMIALSATAIAADEIDDTDGTTHEIRVVNNYQQSVRVYVQDAKGKLHQLGRVARGHFKVLELSDEIARMGGVQLKVYPATPSNTLAEDGEGMRSKALEIAQGEAVNVVLGDDLTQSMIQVEKG